MTASNRQLITDFIEAWNNHDVERVIDYYAPDCWSNDVGESQPQVGRQAVRQSITRYLEAFPDLFVEQRELIIQDEQAVLVWSAQATHHGRFMNIPPTGRQVTWQGMTLLKLDNNKVQHSFNLWDVAAFLRGIGLLPKL